MTTHSAHPSGGAINGFGTHRAAEIAGITYRQIDYWDRTDLLVPSLARATGSGSRRQYSYSDLLKLKVIKRLLDSGIKLEKVRSIVDYMSRELEEDVSTANLVIDGSTVVLVRSDAQLIDMLQKGQGVLNVVPLSIVNQEVDAAIVDLFPAQGAALSDSLRGGGDDDSLEEGSLDGGLLDGGLRAAVGEN